MKKLTISKKEITTAAYSAMLKAIDQSIIDQLRKQSIAGHINIHWDDICTLNINWPTDEWATEGIPNILLVD